MPAPPDDQKNLSPDPIARMAEASCNHGELNQRLDLTWDNLNEEERQPHINGMVAAVRELQQIVFERGRGAKRPALEQEVAELIKEHEQRETDDRGS